MPDDSNHIRPPMNPPPYSPAQAPYNPAAAAPGQGSYEMEPQPQVTIVHPQTTIVQGPTVMPALVISGNLGPKSTPYYCSKCNQQIVTTVKKTASMRTHVCAGVLCFFMCWPCVCLPYCMDSCMRTEHYCSNCEAFIGRYDR